MRVVILAAGKGSRLGGTVPKPLTCLSDGRSIMESQLHAISQVLPLERVIVVTGYKKEMIFNAFPNLLFAFNPDFSKENTSKSLLRALGHVDDDCIWMNGDVVFDPEILKLVLEAPHSCMVVNDAVVGEEEVKYTADSSGRILEVSKELKEPLGEALGINRINQADLPLFREMLEKCEAQDYFEKGLELAIQSGLDLRTVRVDAESCVEVDFPEDLAHANALLAEWHVKS